MNWISNHIVSATITLLLSSTVAAQVTTVPIEIEFVDASERKITVRYNDKVTTLTLSDDAAIIVEGKANNLTMVIPGHVGNVEYDKKIAAVTKLDVQSNRMAHAESLDEGWEEVDQRLIFLMVRLVDVEANLEAIDKEMGHSQSRAGVAKGQASRAQSRNDRMDQRAGGPVRWDKFYGTTAEKFFYHPTENHTYHTQTVLSQQSPGQSNQGKTGVPSYQGLPVHQRPPQFDYMYRANENAQRRAQAEVANLRGNTAALASRRHELELEQSKLWCEVAFRAVARNDLDRKALYRFAPSGSGKEDLLAATHFVVTALSVVDNGQKDQSNTFRQIKSLISVARYDLGNSWLKLGIKHQSESTDEWRFVELARKLEDISANLGDSYTVSVERESAGDWQRRDMYRGLLQKALIQYAETVLALDEMASEMAKSRGFEPDLDAPLEIVSVKPTKAVPADAVSRRDATYRSIFNGRDLTGWHGEETMDPRKLAAMPAQERGQKMAKWQANASKNWIVESGELVNYGTGVYLTTDDVYGNYELLIEYKTTPEADSGIYLRSSPQVQIWNHKAKKLSPGQDKGSGGLWNNSPGAPGKDPSEIADLPFGQWNSFKIRQIGSYTSVWLNGKHVVDNAIMENYWDRTKPLPAEGRIQLQTHGGEIRWRNIMIREIGAEEARRILSNSNIRGF